MHFLILFLLIVVFVFPSFAKDLLKSTGVVFAALLAVIAVVTILSHTWINLW